MNSIEVYQEFANCNIIGVGLKCVNKSMNHTVVQLTIEDLGSTSMTLNGQECDKVEWTLRGESVRGLVIKVLRDIVSELTMYRTLTTLRKLVIQVEDEFQTEIIAATVEHNGEHGGDAGHGGYVRLIVENLANSIMEINGEECDKFELELRGDSERSTLIDALTMCYTVLDGVTYNELYPF